MRESLRQKFDRIYTTQRRRRLAQTYRGDPSDPANTERVMREEIFGPSKSHQPTEGAFGVWIPQFWYRQIRSWIRNQRGKDSR